MQFRGRPKSQFETYSEIGVRECRTSAGAKKRVRWRSTDKETKVFKVGDHLATSGFSDPGG